MGEFLVAEIDAKVGGFGIIPPELDGAIVSSHYFLYQLNDNKINKKFLDYFLRTPAFQEQIKAQGSTNYAAIRPNDVLEYTIPLPPLEKQCHIVERIEKLSGLVEEARKLRIETRENMDALLSSTNEITFRKKKNWKEKQVIDFCEKPQYGYTESATEEPIGPRFLRITDIQDGKVNWNVVPYCVCPKPEKYLLKPNDLVFARTGATTGKSYLIRECPKAVFASYLIRLRVKSLVSVEYLYRYFQSPSYWAQIMDKKKGTGQPNVNGKKLSNIIVPIPPSEEQRAIIEYLDDVQKNVDIIRKLHSETDAELNALMPSILDKAFKGELV